MRFAGIFVLLAGILASPFSAQAGFEWIAPEAAQQQPSVGVYPLPPLSATRNAPEVISPVIISGDNEPEMKSPLSPAPMPSAPPLIISQTPAPQPQMQSQPQYQPPAPQPQAAVLPLSNLPAPPPAAAPQKLDLSTATITMPPPSSGGDIVQGFASQIPLALALRQILPVGYNFSIDQSIDMDTSVSYKGGKPWRETVRDMLMPVGLVSHEQGATLSITRAAAPAVAVSAPMPATAETAPAPVLQMTPPPASSSIHADMPSVNINSPDGWTATHGDTLHKVLLQWCSRAGVELQWLAEYDYPVEASAHFSGSFEDAVRGLLAGFETARPQPIGELHSNANAGQMVLVVSPRGNSYSN